MRYSLKTMDGNKFNISEEEYKAIILGDGLIVLSSCGVTINKSRIETIYPESSADMVEERKNQQEGILHDGTRVIRHFGRWVDASLQVPDDEMKFGPVGFDETYYPEISRDCVPTPMEYQKIASLPIGERKRLILQSSNERRMSSGDGLKKLTF